MPRDHYRNNAHLNCDGPKSQSVKFETPLVLGSREGLTGGDLLDAGRLQAEYSTIAEYGLLKGVQEE